MEAESSFGELEVPKTDQLTETDPVKPHERVPREDEPENKKEPGNIHKIESNFLVESVGAESSSGELEAECPPCTEILCLSRFLCFLKNAQKSAQKICAFLKTFTVPFQ